MTTEGREALYLKLHLKREKEGWGLRGLDILFCITAERF